MKTPDPTKAESSAPNRPKFTGTDNPRHLRAITALMRRPISRQELDSVAGASNTAPNWWQSFAAVALKCRASASALSTATATRAALASIRSRQATAASFTGGKPIA